MDDAIIVKLMNVHYNLISISLIFINQTSTLNRDEETYYGLNSK